MTRTTLSVLACAFAAAHASGTDDLSGFERWAAQHGKAYASPEERKARARIWASNVAKINAHNAQEDATGEHGWRQGVNKFADLTPSEWRARYTGLYLSPERQAQLARRRVLATAATAADEATIRAMGDNRLQEDEEVVADAYGKLPRKVDWDDEGGVTPVKNQGQCGSCWAFSSTGALEGLHFVETGDLVSLSEQQLVDCSVLEGNLGCSGGLMDNAFKYVQRKGLCAEDEYPYTATQGLCNDDKCEPVVAGIEGFKDVKADDDKALQRAVSLQPISVAIEADQSSFQFYTSGVMTAPCGTNLDHGVLLVGYGQEKGKPFWRVKNSWGADWGDNGYIKLGRGKKFAPHGQCGILMMSSAPTKEADPPAASGQWAAAKEAVEA